MVLMSRVEIISKVGADGVLRLSLPLGIEEANREVKVIVESVDLQAPLLQPNQEEWREFVKDMAGCISDPTFQPLDQMNIQQSVVEDCITANDPELIGEIRRIRNEEDLAGAGKDITEVLKRWPFE